MTYVASPDRYERPRLAPAPARTCRMEVRMEAESSHGASC